MTYKDPELNCHCRSHLAERVRPHPVPAPCSPSREGRPRLESLRLTSHTWACQVNTPQFQSSILTFLQNLFVVVVLPGSAGRCSGVGTQGFWPHTPQLFSCGSARPGEWLATECHFMVEARADRALSVSFLPHRCAPSRH